jgi:hypothetical protein
MSSHSEQAMDAYRVYRVLPQADFYRTRVTRFERALRQTTKVSAVLLVLAALCGALGVADASRRGMWAFLAAAFAAVSTAIAAYEVAFGFERLGRQYQAALAALELLDAERPLAPDDPAVARHVTRSERLLRSEVDTWSHLDEERATGSSGTS